jgi:putative oxidoreductase
MPLLRPASPRQIDAGLLALRVITGVIFAAHGGQKLFVYGLTGVAGSFGQMGVPMAEIAGPLVAFVEFFGGLALIAGLLTRLAAVGTAVVMAGAMLIVHLPAGFFAPQGVEFPLALFGAAMTLMFTGAGAFSADAMVAGRNSQPVAAAERAGERRRVQRVA